jgi:hypothetical protein
MGDRQMIDPTDYKTKHTIVGLILGTLNKECHCDYLNIRCSRCYLLDATEEVLPVFYFEAKRIYDAVAKAHEEVQDGVQS